MCYLNPKGAELRTSKHPNRVANFLIKWVEELYGEWASFMQIMLHGCKVSKKT